MYKPLAFDVLIERIPEEQVTQGGIILMSTDNIATNPTAYVKDMGIMAKAFFEGHKAPVSVGDVVMYQRHNDFEVEIEGTTYTLVKAQSIIAVI